MTDRYRSLNCVPPKVRDRPRYVADHVIRHYAPLGLAALLRDLGADPTIPELEIVGGIGRLVLRANGLDVWDPSITRAPDPPPRPAPPDLLRARLAVCSSCDSYRDNRCTAAGCGCTGEGKPGVWSSRCPLLLWLTSSA